MRLTKEQKELIKGEDLVNDGEVEAFLRGYKKKFGKSCGKEFDQDNGTPVYCGMIISGILHLCEECKKVPKINLNVQER